MIIKINKKIGQDVVYFEIDEKDIFDGLFNVSQITSIPTHCTECKSDKVELQSNKSKGKGENTGKEYTFVKIRCKDCGADAQAGQYASGTGIFWKKFETYKKNNSEQIDNRKEETPTISEEDINI